MGLWRSLNGVLTVEILSADPIGSLAEIQNTGIALEHIAFPDELTMQLQIRRQDIKWIQKITDRRGEKLRILSRGGFYWKFRSLIHRPVLLAGLIFLILLTLFLPTRVYFFRVEGNQSVPTRQILEISAEYGINFGASRREIRSEKVKNAVLQAIPQLEWVGINTTGCVATISVRERQYSEQTPEIKGVTSIVASRDGVIQNLTVTSGSAAVKTGQAVKEGQVLISGYTDCGIAIRANRAQGEIYANTHRQYSFLTPENPANRGEISSQIKKRSIIFGKKRINFYQGSGILDTSCVKMYEENYVTLPGGFQLPIAFVTETWIYYEETAPAAIAEQAKDNLVRFAEFYLRSQMVAGQILEKEEDFIQEEGVFRLDGEYGCLEMIGRERKEEIIGP